MFCHNKPLFRARSEGLRIYHELNTFCACPLPVHSKELHLQNIPRRLYKIFHRIGRSKWLRSWCQMSHQLFKSKQHYSPPKKVLIEWTMFCLISVTRKGTFYDACTFLFQTSKSRCIALNAVQISFTVTLNSSSSNNFNKHNRVMLCFSHGLLLH